jgi:hypothetical protein
MSVIRGAQARLSETPGGVMTTFASPTQGGASQSLWKVQAKPGAEGPVHDFDVEQVWHWVDGAATVGDIRPSVWDSGAVAVTRRRRTPAPAPVTRERGEAGWSGQVWGRR